MTSISGASSVAAAARAAAPPPPAGAAVISGGRFNVFEGLTMTDRQVLGAASGLELDADGAPVAGSDPEAVRDWSRLAVQVALDRRHNLVRGDLTPDYFSTLMRNTIADSNSQLNIDMLGRAFDLLSNPRVSGANGETRVDFRM